MIAAAPKEYPPLPADAVERLRFCDLLPLMETHEHSVCLAEWAEMLEFHDPDNYGRRPPPEPAIVYDRASRVQLLGDRHDAGCALWCAGDVLLYRRPWVKCPAAATGKGPRFDAPAPRRPRAVDPPRHPEATTPEAQCPRGKNER